MPTTPRWSLSAWLALLVAGAVLPLLLFSALTLRGLLQSARAQSDRGQVDTARALALAVDGEVHSWMAALAALAESKSARPGRWAEFYEEARQVGAQHEGWVVLSVASGEQILNTLLPFGAPLQKTSSPETIDAIFREGKPIVSDLIWGKNAQRYLVAVAVPVTRGGKVVYCLTLNFSPDRLTKLLVRQQFPATWVAAIIDRQRRVVARSVLADTRVGKPIVEWFAAATRAAESGIATGPLMDGRLGQVAFQRLQEVPWVVALAVPVAELQSAAPILGFLSLGMILGLVAVGMAVYMGRKVVAPVRTLALTGERLLRGEGSDLGPPSRIREMQELREALVEASAAVRAHTEERERITEALRHANETLEGRVAERTAALASANQALQAVNADLQGEIAQRSRAEAEARALARFPAENPNPVLRLDADGRILFANAASAPILDQWGTAVGGLAPAPWPSTIRDALARQSGDTVELACGSRTYVVSVTAIPEAGYVNLYMSDITTRKEAETAQRESREDLNRAQAVAHTGSWRLNVRRNELTWSDENWRIFGLPKGMPLTYETFLGTIHPEDRAYVHERWSAALRGEPYDIEHRVVVGDAVKWVRERAELEFDADTTLLGGFGTTQDISARKEAEERIRASLREKEVLLKEIHHRVKNNLQVIASLVSLQADGLDDPSLRDLFRDVHDRVRSMALVHEKLYQSESLAQVDFGEYARSLASHLWRAHGAAKARIQLRLDVEPVRLSVETAVPCGLILNELAGNALKHAFAGRAAGEVAVSLRADPDGRVRLGVRDNGVGLPDGLDWRQARSLGLRLVQMLTAQLRGAVAVRCGAGTEFTVTFTPPGAPGAAAEERRQAGEGRP